MGGERTWRAPIFYSASVLRRRAGKATALTKLKRQRGQARTQGIGMGCPAHSVLRKLSLCDTRAAGPENVPGENYSERDQAES